MNRRTLLAGGVASLAPAAPPTKGIRVTRMPSHPDADLLAACAEFVRIERLWLATDFSRDSGTPEERAANAEREKLHEAQAPFLEIICGTPAQTVDGILAIARAAIAFDAEALADDDPDDYVDRRLVAAMFRSVARVGLT